MPMTTLGFLGLGVMGGPMARNLVKAGYPVVGFDTDARRLGNFAAGGGQPAMSVGEAAAGGAVVLLSLPTGDVVREVVTGAAGLLTVMKSGTIIVDLSTTQPQVAQDAAHAAEDTEQDNRSDNKGPEPEGVAVARFGAKTYAFIALERVGGIMVYDVTTPTAPTFVSYLNSRDQGVGDRGPEGMVFVPADDSPSREPLLIVGNEVSGTTVVHRIRLID